jgi:hypothetical protein
MFRTTKKRKVLHSHRQFRTLQTKEEEEDEEQGNGDRLKISDHVGTTSPVEGDEDDPTVIIRRKTKDAKKKLKLRGVMARSFEMVEKDDNNNDNDYQDDGHHNQPESGHESSIQQRKSRKKRNRKNGFGFGGLPLPSPDAEDDDEEAIDGDNQQADATGTTYGKDAMDKLKSAQRLRPLKEATEDEDLPFSSITPAGKAPDNAASGDIKSTLQSSSPALPSFVPLNSDYQELEILTGEDAMEFVKSRGTRSASSIRDIHTDLGLDADGEHFDTFPEDSADWEDQIVRRAGIPQSTSQTAAAKAITGKESSRPLGNIQSLATLKKQLDATVYSLQAQYEDLENATMRRQAEHAQTQADLQRHRQSLEDSGKACDYYQELRLLLTPHVGALRDIQEKIQPTCDALLKLVLSQLETRQTRTNEWQDDVASILREADLLDRVIGRQPKFSDTASTERTVDEFGRDVQSQYARQRERRCLQRLERHRQQLRRRNPNISTENITETAFDASFWVDEQEARDWKDRYLALQEATRIALQDLDDDYTSLPKLLQVFRDWRKLRPDEYHQCYANLSLADLSSVLVMVDLCRSQWLCGMTAIYDEVLPHHASEQEHSQTATLVNGVSELAAFLKEDQRENTEDQRVVGRALEKSILSFLLKIVEHPNSLVFPSWTSLLLSQLVSDVIERLQGEGIDSNVAVLLRFEQALNMALKSALENLTLPILKAGAQSRIDENIAKIPQEQVLFAVTSAQGSQVDYIKQVLMALLQHWVPVVELLSSSQSGNGSGGRLVGTILNFVSSKFLFLLSSLENRNMASASFKSVWDILRNRHSGCLSAPQHFLQTAPIRAAAAAYGLQEL